MNKYQIRQLPLIGCGVLSRGRAAGFSIVEFMVAIAIGLIILVALTALFVNSSANRREIDRSATILENGRYAMSVLKSELSLAGYYGTLSAPSGDTEQPCSNDVAVWGGALNRHVQGSNGNDAVLDDCFSTIPAFPGRKANTDAILIQRASTCVAGPTAETGCAAIANGSAYLQVSECGDEYETTPFVLAKKTGGNLNQFSLKNRLAGGTNCGAVQTAPIRMFYRSIYYVDIGNRLMRADRIPDGAWTTPVVIAEGIEDMQLQYGFDTAASGDGTPDVFDNSPSGTTWGNAVGARVWLLARAGTESVGFSNAKTFEMGDVSVAPTDGFKRHVFSSYISFVNPSGKRFK